MEVFGTEVHMYMLYGGASVVPFGGQVEELVRAAGHMPSISAFSSFTFAIISVHPVQMEKKK